MSSSKVVPTYVNLFVIHRVRMEVVQSRAFVRVIPVNSSWITKNQIMEKEMIFQDIKTSTANAKCTVTMAALMVTVSAQINANV